MVNVKCYSCGAELSFSSKIGRREECEKCRSDVHVCKNCAHYDQKAYNECREIQAERVQEKEKANFCDYFDPLVKSQSSQQDSAADLRAKAEALFKKR